MPVKCAINGFDASDVCLSRMEDPELDIVLVKYLQLRICRLLGKVRQCARHVEQDKRLRMQKSFCVDDATVVYSGLYQY
jgi:hypothetical protein